MNRAVFSIPSLMPSQTGDIAEVVGILGYPSDEPEIPSFSHSSCYIRPRKGFLQRLFRGFASSIVDEISMHLEDQLLRELRLQVRM
jgi:hypothetical protein